MNALLVALLLSADPRNPYLMQAKVFYQGLEFEKCFKRLDQAGKWNNDKDQLAEIELYQGLCALPLGKEKDAVEHFELALAIDEALQLPPLQGPKVTALFEKARAKVLAAKPKPAPAPEPEPVKPEPVVAEPEKPAEPVVADAPVQPVLVPEPTPAPVEVVAPAKSRHLVVPIVVAGLGVAATGIAAYFGTQAKALEQQANGAKFESDAVAAGGQARSNALSANVAWAVAGAAAIGAVVSYVLMN